MNATRTPEWRVVSIFVLTAGILAPGLLRAEVGVAIPTGSTAPVVPYILNDISEDPTPVSQVWRKFGSIDLLRPVLNANGDDNGDGPPSLVSDAGSGLVVAAWARNSANGFDVVVSRFANGAWTAPAVVVGSTENEFDPMLVLDPNGSIHMFYWVDSATPKVFHVVAPADLSSWSAPQQVSQFGPPACRPAGAFHDGVLRVAYEVHNLGTGHAPRQVVLARLDNGVFTPEVIADTNNLGSIFPQVHSQSGHFWVDWVDAEDGTGGGELAWVRLNAQGQWEAIRYEPFANDEQRENLVRGGARMKAIELP
jgi:hypothetical protein